MGVRVLKGGMLTTVQDLGRTRLSEPGLRRVRCHGCTFL